MKPQNDLELAGYVTDLVQSANKLNQLMREGHLYKACAAFSRIEDTAASAQKRINQIVDMAG